MTNNDETPTPAPRPAATVTLTAIPAFEWEAAMLRHLLPSADAREEVHLVPGLDGKFRNEVESVFRCTFASVPHALYAKSLLRPSMRTRVDATMAVSERELVLLACYYIDGFLWVNRGRHLFEPAYVPLTYDELPRPDTFFNCTVDVYYLHRLRELESILGCERVRSIYDVMAAHPDRPGWSDFQLAGAIANLGAEKAWRSHEQSAAARAADIAEFEAEFNFDLEVAEEQWRRYDAWRAEETARIDEGAAWGAEDPASGADGAAAEAGSDFRFSRC